MKTGTSSLEDAPPVAPVPSQPEPPRALADLVAQADVQFNGPRPWDMQVYDAAAYRRILTRGSLGLGESYVDGQWDTGRLDELINRLLRAELDIKLVGIRNLHLLASVVSGRIRDFFVNRQTSRRAYVVGERHYDIGNDIYEAMLDPTLSYSCGYWDRADNLEAAQRAKLDLVCRKLQLRSGEHVLDVGCGWGGLAAYAARHYDVRVTGITVSKEQQALARERVQGLDVEIALMDYRDLRGRFDKVVSLGMFEHVGPKNYRAFFRRMHDLLPPGGLLLLQTIGEYQTTRSADPWLDKYIFPNGKLPSCRRIAAAFEGLFTLQDWHNFGPDYDLTLMAWWRNFERAWPELGGEKYDQRFYRLWKYYLQSCAGVFRAGWGQLWQVVLSTEGLRRTYRSVR